MSLLKYYALMQFDHPLEEVHHDSNHPLAEPCRLMCQIVAIATAQSHAPCVKRVVLRAGMYRYAYYIRCQSLTQFIKEVLIFF